MPALANARLKKPFAGWAHGAIAAFIKYMPLLADFSDALHPALDVLPEFAETFANLPIVIYRQVSVAQRMVGGTLRHFPGLVTTAVSY